MPGDKRRKAELRCDIRAKHLCLKNMGILGMCVNRVFDIFRASEVFRKNYRDDAFQMGYFALYRAAQLWDPMHRVRGKPVHFSTYACHAIIRRLSRWMVTDTTDIHYPAHLFQKTRKKKRKTGLPCSKTPEVLISDLVGVDDEDCLFKAKGPAPEVEANASEARSLAAERVKVALKALDEKARGIIIERYRGKTLNECAEYYGISRERVRQIQAKSLRRMRSYLKRLGLFKGIEDLLPL